MHSYIDVIMFIYFYRHITIGESPVAIPKPIAKPLFLASLAYACSGGTISENSGPVVYDLKQQSGIQVTTNSTVSSLVLGEVSCYSKCNLIWYCKVMLCYVQHEREFYMCAFGYCLHFDFERNYIIHHSQAE